MLKKAGIILVLCSLTACSTIKSGDQNARCHELKTRMIYSGTPYDQNAFNSPANQPMLEARSSTELASIDKEYRQEGCT